MSNVFVTSDIHFSHLNILKYNAATRGNFRDVDHMNEVIVQRWNETVGVDDHTFILGDVSMGDVSKAPGYIQRLNGTKTLILGNHDRSLMKIEGIRDLFVGVHDYLVYSHTKHEHYILFHFPISSWDDRHRGSVHLHGHLHGAPSGLTGRLMDVGMDCNDLRPFALTTIQNRMAKIPKPNSDHHGDKV
ncbi:COG4186 Predicted phosphoesterase or phosphohydrolase [uncultured Caudovirales phage]|uniref:COG4186 Predicted phosphoesterase or phosphohydrolase n=1 Tax=uncultured Caudovirales phage TaxID=2100421 RepID=A0A6J5LAJ3_9CAUD|nr:COG4186 Predicted phosphoesterase or phosphohydrolase [uncultured Caudovirales phage]